MLKVLIAGLSPDLEPWLLRRLGDVSELTLETAHTGEETLLLLGHGKYHLLVVDDFLDGITTGEVIARARHELRLDNLRVIYCLERNRLGRAGEDLSSKLLKDDQIIFHPVDREKLARDILVSCACGTKAQAEEGAGGDDSLDSVAADLWSQFKEHIFGQVTALEQGIAALLDGTSSPDGQKQAQREAHKLAGSLGSLGFAHGTQVAREIEQTLRTEVLISQAEFLRLCDSVIQLRDELERGPVSSVQQVTPEAGRRPAVRDEKRPLLLVIDNDRELASALAIEAARRGLRAELATNQGQMRDVVSRSSPSAILLDPAFPEGIDKGLACLSELAALQPAVPVLVFTSGDSFEDRLKVAQLEAQAFLEKPMSAPRVLEAVMHLLDRKQVSRARVLAVDDDPIVLESLQRLLEPQGIMLSVLSDPLRFWDRLEGFSPDLLLLDVDMPHVSGIELCRVLRNDMRWSGIPILFLTAYGDSETLQKVFAAGADDFVTKPFVGPELLARISTRIERTHQLLTMVERDKTSGTESSITSIGYLDRLFRLASRRKEKLCLVALGLDDFGQINASYGRATGDRVYRRLGQLLMCTFRIEDAVSRWEGDEFVLGLYGMARGDGVQRLAELLEAFRQEEFTADSGCKFRVTFSAGVAQDLKDGPDLQALYRTASEALGRARKMGGDRVLTSGRFLSEGDSPQGPDIVVVDDDETLSSLLLHAITTRGYRAQCFKDGRTALAKLGGPLPELRPQVLLLDVDLPNMDGLSVLRRLAEDGVVKRTRVIMLTARSSEAEVVNALEWGAFDHVAKPFSLRVLMQRIRRAMEV
jgi:diguanylate cyclase (GGDEF)-like protein